MKLTLQFTHPPMAVSPNGRVHWGRRAKLVAELRRAAFVHALAARRSAPAGDCFLPVGYALVWYYKYGHLWTHLEPVVHGIYG